MAVVVEFTPGNALAVEALLAAAAATAVEAAGQQLLAASQPLVPVDTGELKASGAVTVDGHTARVSYARESEDGFNVAVKQHEDLTLAHPGGGQAQYLRQPLHSEAHALVEGMSRIVAAVLK